MAETHIKQLEDKIARYERIMNYCRQCKAAMPLENVEDTTPPPVSATSPGSSEQNPPKASTSARKSQTTRSSKEATSSSQTEPPASSSGGKGSAPLKRASSNRSGKNASGPPSSTARPLTRTTKQTAAGQGSSSTSGSSTRQGLTAHSLEIRAMSLNPPRRSTDTLSATVNTQKKDQPNLGSPGSNTGGPRTEPPKLKDWEAASDKMLGEIPLGWVWHARIWGLDKSMLAAVTKDTSAAPNETLSVLDDPQDKHHLLGLVRRFAHRHSSKRINFQQLLLVCLCNVLSAQDVPRSSIVETLQICISDTSEANIGRYLRGARWVNKILDRLFFAGWRYRAIDLLVLCTQQEDALRCTC